MGKVYIIANTIQGDFIIRAATADKALAEKAFAHLTDKFHNTDYEEDLEMLVFSDEDILELLKKESDSLPISVATEEPFDDDWFVGNNSEVFYTDNDIFGNHKSSKDIFLEIIRANCTHLGHAPVTPVVYTVNVDSNTSLTMVADENNIRLQLTCAYDNDVRTMFFDNFASDSTIDQITLTYDNHEFNAFFEKSKASTSGGMLYDLTCTEDLPYDVLYDLEKKSRLIDYICNHMVIKTLEILERLFKESTKGISLADFGYINFSSNT